MKFLLLFLTPFIIGFKNTDTKQNKYVPVYISMLDSSNISPGLLLHLKAGFGARKIKTLTREDVETLIYNEGYSVTENYFKSGGNILDREKLMHYQANNMRIVGNSLALSIKIDAAGFIRDTVKWCNRTLPINMVVMYKPSWHYMILDSNNARNMLQMSQSIVDSIIASNVLVKE